MGSERISLAGTAMSVNDTEASFHETCDKYAQPSQQGVTGTRTMTVRGTW